ncbi:ATP synthase F1 subunit gamma [Buchnera aphidicola (Formosaphis micheliae)]|uniref:ATP synthase F1 subunit gamma n=1 Tax=Buchnera aphidicola TaxID=9 RepID=UPI0031B8772B
MAAEKELRIKINSISNTKKITQAMEMISISKINKIKSKIKLRTPYIESMRIVINRLLQRNLQYKHIYIDNDIDIKRIGIIVVSTDKGLCGSLNINLFKKILSKVKYFNNQNIVCDFFIFGLKGFIFFDAMKYSIIHKVVNIGDKPSISKFSDSIELVLNLYKKNVFGKLFLASNQCNSSILQTPKIIQLLPFKKIEKKKIETNEMWNYLYEPDSKSLLNLIFNRYIESKIYQGVLENIASEQTARMIAMKMATDNSNNMIKELRLIYNKTRQEAITNELIAIITGASAVSLN